VSPDNIFQVSENYYKAGIFLSVLCHTATELKFFTFGIFLKELSEENRDGIKAAAK
jgi:hypothetical protein